jgi:hypothetical protein
MNYPIAAIPHEFHTSSPGSETSLEARPAGRHLPFKQSSKISARKPSMKQSNRMNLWARRLGTVSVIVTLSCALPAALAADFTVTTPGGQFAFNINGANSPSLTLVRGRTYTFAVETSSFHPFRVNSADVINNNITSGTLTYTVPTNGANFTYDCTVHGASMKGTILTVAPPSLPMVRILSISVGTNILLRSTGTNTFTVMPEYKTNLTSTNWFALTVQTNRLADGTNDTICGLPQGAGNALFIRIKSQQN